MAVLRWIDCREFRVSRIQLKTEALARSWHAVPCKSLIHLSWIDTFLPLMSLIYKGSSGLAKVGVASSSLVSRSKFKTLQSRVSELWQVVTLTMTSGVRRTVRTICSTRA
jgi:hypothetical protein